MLYWSASSTRRLCSTPISLFASHGLRLPSHTKSRCHGCRIPSPPTLSSMTHCWTYGYLSIRRPVVVNVASSIPPICTRRHLASATPDPRLPSQTQIRYRGCSMTYFTLYVTWPTVTFPDVDPLSWLFPDLFHSIRHMAYGYLPRRRSVIVVIP